MIRYCGIYSQHSSSVQLSNAGGQRRKGGKILALGLRALVHVDIRPTDDDDSLERQEPNNKNFIGRRSPVGTPLHPSLLKSSKGQEEKIEDNRQYSSVIIIVGIAVIASDPESESSGTDFFQ